MILCVMALPGVEPGIRIGMRRRIVLLETPYLLVVIAGLDPVIPSDSGGCGGARIKSGHDEEGMDCLCPHFILTPKGTSPAMTQHKLPGWETDTKTITRLYN
jgi:hypothetical protein